MMVGTKTRWHDMQGVPELVYAMHYVALVCLSVFVCLAKTAKLIETPFRSRFGCAQVTMYY